jgi:L,D-peptidoglycan transpeptidase YkuD (ErfK/YbiS/YcfS/YnhG family)
MDLAVDGAGFATWNGRRMRCALGRGGVAQVKREGDGATPAGILPMRRALYRPDRETAPATRLPLVPLLPNDGWCDAPDDPLYNRPVTLPYRAHAEKLWREDRLYDLVVVLGWNDAPAAPGLGSAIFLHLAAPGFAPTEGCVALDRDDLLLVLSECTETSQVIVAG